MSIKIYFKIIFFGTITALLYTHMQMKIVELAYKGKDKEKHIHELTDINGLLTHQILTLKSANHLGNRLLENENNLQFMGRDRVLTLKAPAKVLHRSSQDFKQKEQNPVWNLISYIGVQEAKAWE